MSNLLKLIVCGYLLLMSSLAVHAKQAIPSSMSAIPREKSLVVIPGKGVETHPTNLQRETVYHYKKHSGPISPPDNLTPKQREILWKAFREGVSASSAWTKSNVPSAYEGAKATGKYIIGTTPAVLLTLGMTGFLAGIRCLTEHDEDPIACENYGKYVFDGATIPSIVGYAAAGGYYFRRLGSPVGAPFRSWLPPFAKGVFLGSIAATVIYKMYHDPDLLDCITLGLNYLPQANFDTNEYACKSFVDKWANSSEFIDFANETFPFALNGLTAGAIYWSLSNIGTRLISSAAVAGVVTKLARIPLLNTNIMGWIGHVLLLSGSWYIADHISESEGLLKKHILLGNLPFGSTNEMSNSIWTTQWRVLKGWQNLHDRNWGIAALQFKNPEYKQDPKRQKNVTYTTPETLDFIRQLERYGQLNRSWRANALSGVRSALNDWSKKMVGFRGLIGGSYNVYRMVIKKVIESRGGKVTEPDLAIPSVEEFMEGIESERFEDAKKEAEVRSGPLSQSFINYVSLDNELSFELIGDRQLDWSGLNLSQIGDYLSASMACGPEAEIGPVSTKAQTSSIIGGWISSFWKSEKDQRSLIYAPDGTVAKFYPPRITKNLDGYDLNRSVCDEIPNQIIYKSETIPALDDPQNPGFVKYILANIREDVLDTDHNGLLNEFDHWWLKNVLGRLTEFEKQFFYDYADLIWKKFMPIYTAGGYEYCQNPSSAGHPTPFAKDKINSYVSRDCTASTHSRLATGPLLSTTDEIKLNLEMWLDLVETNPYGFEWFLLKAGVNSENSRMRDALLSKEVSLFKDKMQNFLTQLDNFQRLFGSNDAIKVGALNEKIETLTVLKGMISEMLGRQIDISRFNGMERLSEEEKNDLFKTNFSNAEHLAIIFNSNIQNLLTELEGYLGVVHGLDKSQADILIAKLQSDTKRAEKEFEAKAKITTSHRTDADISDVEVSNEISNEGQKKSPKETNDGVQEDQLGDSESSEVQ